MAKYESEGYCPANALMFKEGNIWELTQERAGYLFPYVVYSYGHTANGKPYFTDMLGSEEKLLGYTVGIELSLLIPQKVKDDCKIIVRDLITPGLIPKNCNFHEENDTFVVGIRKVPEGTDPLEKDDPSYDHHSHSIPKNQVEVFVSKK